MGMYDEIHVDYPLPGDPPYKDFQTKDLDCTMGSYTITAGGRLIEHTYVLDFVPEEERPFFGKPEWEHPFMRMCGCLKREETGDVDTNYHGLLIFYTGKWSNELQKHLDWYEYRAKFTDGTLVDVERIAR